jgi:endonuclease III
MKLQISPYNTRQEEYRDDPWKMLMVCFMLNQTSHKQVDQVRHEFFDRFPTPEALVAAEESEIASMIKSLGFYNRRAKSWKEFSKQWIEAVEEYGTSVPLSVLEDMRGVGRYALDSWKVFQLFQYDTEVHDHVLNWYVDWARQEVERLAREASPWKPMVVYYLHFKDDRYFINNWNRRGDYVCCVMARTIGEAIEKTEKIALNQQGAQHIKIMGISNGIDEWVDEEKPLTTDEENYTRQVTALFERIKNKKAA